MAGQVEKRNVANGLMTAVNPLAAPEGALVEATNVVINEPNTIEPRRGFDDYFGRHTNSPGRYYSHLTESMGFGGLHSRDVIDRGDILYWVLTYDDQFVMVHNHPQGTAAGIAAGVNDWYNALSTDQSSYNSLPLVPYTTLDGYAMPSVLRFRDLTLLTTGHGVRRTQSYSFGSDFAGLPKPLYLNAALSKTGTEAVRWFPQSNKSVSTVAFRVVFYRETTAAGVTDVDRVVISAPSDRFVLVSEILPDITSVTPTGSNNEYSFVFSATHNFASGDRFSIVSGPSDPSYKRSYQVKSVTNATTVVTTSSAGLTGTPPTAADEWTRYMAATVQVPSRGLGAATYRLYRTNLTTVPTSVGATDPGDEMLMIEDVVWSYNATTSEFSTNVVGFDVELGSLLYTNPSQQTISKSNDRPPISAVMAQFANHIFYANNRLLAKGEVRLKTTTGMVNGSTITVTLSVAGTASKTTVVFTAGAAENLTNRIFQLHTSGTPSQNVERTVRSLVRVINRQSTMTAGHVSDFNDVPGRFTIASDQVAWDTLQITSSVPTLFDPELPVEFKDEQHPNRLYYSKLQQPDHVPALNFFDVGDLNAEITNLVPSDDRLLVITTQGIYQLSGYGESSFSVQPVDLTIRTVAPRATVNLEGQVFALTQSGFSRISGGEVQTISTSIDDEVVKRIRWSNTFANAFAIADPVRREILVWLPLAENSDRTLGFRFSVATGAWTRIDREALAGGFLAGKGDLVLALSTSTLTTHKLVVQRTTGSDTADYRDEGLSTTILGQDGDEVTMVFTDAFHPTPAPGWMLEQGDEKAVILSVRKDPLNQFTLTLDKAVQWGGGTARLYPGIKSKVTPVSFVGGNAAILKQFVEVAVALKDNTVRQVTLGLTTDQTRTEFPLVIDNPSLSFGWGKSPWGKSPWGSPRREEIDIALRSFVPPAANYGRSLKVSFQHDRAGERYQLVEMSVALSPNTERTVR